MSDLAIFSFLFSSLASLCFLIISFASQHFKTNRYYIQNNMKVRVEKSMRASVSCFSNPGDFVLLNRKRALSTNPERLLYSQSKTLLHYCLRKRKHNRQSFHAACQLCLKTRRGGMCVCLGKAERLGADLLTKKKKSNAKKLLLGFAAARSRASFLM